MVPRNHTSWLFPVENCPDFNCLLSLTFVHRLTYSVLELGQAKGMILYRQLRGEKKKRSFKRNILNKIQAFSRKQAGEADVRKLCIWQISRVGLQSDDSSRRWQTPS